ncbi:hypothetical protein THMIRHAS_17010 [Thiosulfatimonas sediminis]|uniref:Uncharacterized protein n=1 Tax=Thiosulfatimonas sediminis TaxID=2675054 RepID=A0A6F8PWE8_9GAMM|nr:hypothetical protein [Thiosulfatimonas sediminis]BBP46328.1 hypothetical protein THMIRHAS_17010 [Thiosulfatimonas sediminis]
MISSIDDSITLNQSQRLFVISAGGGYSCLGFDVLFKKLKAMSSLLNLELPKESEIGKLCQYAQYENALDVLRAKGGFKQTWYDPDTKTKVKKALEKCRKDERVIRVFYGDTDSGRAWLEEFDVIGRVGRSTGLMKIPLLVPDGEYGGGSLLDSQVVRIVDVATGEVAYSHPNFSLPKFKIVEYLGGEMSVGVEADGKLHAQFESLPKAAAWIAFMSGECLCQSKVEG